MYKELSIEAALAYMDGSGIEIIKPKQHAEGPIGTRYEVVINRRGELETMCTFRALISSLVIVAEEFELTGTKNMYAPPHRELFLKVALTKVIQWAQQQAKKNVVVYSDDTLMPNLLMDANFSIQSGRNGKKVRGFKAL